MFYKFSYSIALPVSFIFIILCPGIILSFLSRNRQKLFNSSVRLKFGFLYNEYRLKAYYWEFLKMYQRVLVVGFLNFYENEVPVKGFLVILVITVYIILAKKNFPYLASELNRIDVNAAYVCFISIIFLLL